MNTIEEAKRNIESRNFENAEVVSVVLSDEYITAKKCQADTVFERELTEELAADIDMINEDHRLPEYITLSSYPDCIEKPYRTLEEAIRLYNANIDEIEEIMTEISDKAKENFADRELIDVIIPYELPDLITDCIRYSNLPAVEAVRCNLYKEIEKNL